jgi:hypothetical protein
MRHPREDRTMSPQNAIALLALGAAATATISCHKIEDQVEHRPIVQTIPSLRDVPGEDSRLNSFNGGKFVVLYNSHFCFGRPEYDNIGIDGINASKLYRQKNRVIRMFYPISLESADRTITTSDSSENSCFRERNNISIGLRLEPNNMGDIYKITIIARQEKAWWQGTINHKFIRKTWSLNHKENDMKSFNKSVQELIDSDINTIGENFFLYLARSAEMS